MSTRPSPRLIGEVAYQLDRRILGYVFNCIDSNRKRYYGYTIRNIQEKITREAIDPRTGMLDVELRNKLDYRYRYVLRSLGPLGYKVDHHCDFTTDMVNKYGLLPLPPEKFSPATLTADKQNLLANILTKVTPDHERKDILIILASLALLAQDDGKPMILW